ncbi:MAG TPA: hypothetical protein VJN66_00605, partial [Rhodanobacteraceae bacterium]|nr:hypothetical protein [Rhodanobacteraceae bacterium]
MNLAPERFHLAGLNLFHCQPHTGAWLRHPHHVRRLRGTSTALCEELRKWRHSAPKLERWPRAAVSYSFPSRTQS